MDIGAFEFAGAYTGTYTSEEDRDWVEKIIVLAKELDEEAFDAESMTNLNDVVVKTETALANRPEQLTAMKYRLEYALMNMKKAGEGDSVTNNILTEADSVRERRHHLGRLGSERHRECISLRRAETYGKQELEN